MENLTKQTIGQMIGVVPHSFKITNDAGDVVEKIEIKIDFSTCMDSDIKAWVCSNRVIAGQRPWRALSKEELEGLKGETFMANDIGKKVKSREERVAEHMSAGLPRKLAQFAVDNPEAFRNAMQKVDVEVPEG